MVTVLGGGTFLGVGRRSSSDVPLPGVPMARRVSMRRGRLPEAVLLVLARGVKMILGTGVRLDRLFDVEVVVEVDATLTLGNNVSFILDC